MSTTSNPTSACVIALRFPDEDEDASQEFTETLHLLLGDTPWESERDGHIVIHLDNYVLDVGPGDWLLFSGPDNEMGTIRETMLGDVLLLSELLEFFEAVIRAHWDGIAAKDENDNRLFMDGSWLNWAETLRRRLCGAGGDRPRRWIAPRARGG